MNKPTRILLVVLTCTYFWYYAHTYTEWHFIDSANLIFHEAGHAIFFFLGQFIQVLMGSGLQVLLPFFISIYFFLHEQKVSGALCLLWVGQNLLNVSVYAGDAINMNLNLLGGDSVIHDWNYLLSTSGLLKYTNIAALSIYDLGILFLVVGTVGAVYFGWKE
jgi:hypothetical protein